MSAAGLSVSVRAELPGFTLDAGWAVRGGFTVLFGYSGAGKSLTLGAIAGTLRPDAGHVRLGDRTLFDAEARVWVPPQERQIGYVAQNAQLFPHMTVRRNIEYALKGASTAHRRARVAQLLDRFRIADLAEKRPHQISGGQRQRAALARALAPRPQVVLLDEPLSALDLPIRIEMRSLLRDVQRELALPVVMVTHDVYEACELADTLVVYSGSGAVQVGAPRELLGDPGTPEIRRLLRAVDVPPSVFEPRREGINRERVLPLERREHVA